MLADKFSFQQCEMSKLYDGFTTIISHLLHLNRFQAAGYRVLLIVFLSTVCDMQISVDGHDGNDSAISGLVSICSESKFS